jgi:hypothetical protein
MLDSLSVEQKIAFEALNLGPVWVDKVSRAQAQTIQLGMVFQTNVESRTEAENLLLGQIFRAAKLPFDDAESLHVGSLKSGMQFDTLLSFDASKPIDALLEKQALKITARIDFPSLKSIASEGKSKALAWQAVKAFLLSQR